MAYGICFQRVLVGYLFGTMVRVRQVPETVIMVWKISIVGAINSKLTAHAH